MLERLWEGSLMLLCSNVKSTQGVSPTRFPGLPRRTNECLSRVPCNRAVFFQGQAKRVETKMTLFYVCTSSVPPPTTGLRSARASRSRSSADVTKLSKIPSLPTPSNSPWGSTTDLARDWTRAIPDSTPSCARLGDSLGLRLSERVMYQRVPWY